MTDIVDSFWKEGVIVKESEVVGLFGTCGHSKWRDKFIEAFNVAGISYFNPNKADWHSNDAKQEAIHLATDRIVVFAITEETYGVASLAEIGFAISNTLHSNRHVIVYVSPTLEKKLSEDEGRYKDSVNARAIINQHLKNVNSLFKVKTVDSLDDLLMMTLQIYQRNVKQII